MVTILSFLQPEELLEIQLAHSVFYYEHVPAVFETCITMLGMVQIHIDRILMKAPACIDWDAIKLWKTLKPMSIELLQKYWSKVESNSPMVDWPEFTVVNGYQPNGFEEFRTGMRHYETGDNHGIVRTEYAGERVEEATYKQGKLHGLSRTVTNRDVMIELFKDG